MPPRLAAPAACAALLASACSTAPAPGLWAKGCPIHMASAPGVGGEGVVVRLLDRAAAIATLAQTEKTLGAPIDRAYLDNPRAVVQLPDGRSTTVLVPPGMSVAVGDRLAFQGSYRSPDSACSYVPNLATRKL